MEHNKIINIVESVYKEIEQDTNHRFKSWEHCYYAFSQNIDIDHLSLHLAFYLASWGMMRGSSGLLQKDYLVHKEAVTIILDKKYFILRGISYKDIKHNSNLIIDLYNDLKIYYNSIKFYKNGKYNYVSATDTLISKIMLGTLGCIPAYDRYLIDGLKQNKLSSKISQNSLEILISKNITDFIEAMKMVNQYSNIEYPIMKIIDMYYWKIGFDLELNKTTLK